MVKKLRYGNTNIFFVQGTGGGLLVDTDFAGTLPAFYRAIKEQGVGMREITHVLATHYHPDHIGLISELMGWGVKLLLMDTQKAHVHFADGIFEREKGLRYEPIEEGRAVLLRCGESRAFLENLGIAGEIISTPSHSADSVVLMLDEGICIAGDLEPYEYLAAYGENAPLQRDWARVMHDHPRIIYYAHANEKALRQEFCGRRELPVKGKRRPPGTALTRCSGRFCAVFTGFQAARPRLHGRTRRSG